MAGYEVTDRVLDQGRRHVQGEKPRQRLLRAAQLRHRGPDGLRGPHLRPVRVQHAPQHLW